MASAEVLLIAEAVVQTALMALAEVTECVLAMRIMVLEEAWDTVMKMKSGKIWAKDAVEIPEVDICKILGAGQLAPFRKKRLWQKRIGLRCLHLIIYQVE
jgi:hypothetical protein